MLFIPTTNYLLTTPNYYTL